MGQRVARRKSSKLKAPTADRTVIGYARVSTQEQNLDMQIAALLNAGVHPDALHVEKVSSAIAKRPKLAAALEELRPGDTLVCFRLDRLARSVSELIQIMGRIREAGANVRSLHETIDTTTPMGKFIFHITAAFAEFERDTITERSRLGVKRAIERGQKFGAERMLSVAQIERGAKLREKGLSQRAAGKMLGCSHATVKKWIW